MSSMDTIVVSAHHLHQKQTNDRTDHEQEQIEAKVRKRNLALPNKPMQNKQESHNIIDAGILKISNDEDHVFVSTCFTDQTSQCSSLFSSASSYTNRSRRSVEDDHREEDEDVCDKIGASESVMLQNNCGWSLK